MPDWEDIIEVVLLQNYNTRLVVLSTTLLGIAAGLIGSFLLLRKRSLMGDALSHATLPGVAIAFAVMVSLGGTGKALPGLLLGATLSGVAGLFTMLLIRNTTRLRDDVAMGFVLSVFFGIGVASLQMVQSLPGASAAGLESFIYGKTASMVQSDFHLIAVVAGVASLISILFLKEFLLLCFDDAYASAQGWPTFFLDVLLLGLVTAVTVIGLQAVGLILIIAFLITPATAARFWTQRLLPMMLLSAGIGGISGWLGASISALTPDLPAGAVIVLVAAALFLLSMLFAPPRGVIPRLMRQYRLRRKVDRQHFLRAAYEILEDSQSGDVVSNSPFSFAHLRAKRTWSLRKLRHILKIAKREDHLEAADPGMLRLSEAGYGEAARVTRNHRLWETYLIHYADIAPSHVDRDADLVEHILGPELVHELEDFLKQDSISTPVPPSPHPTSNENSPS
ncbi:MAG: iron chelate uptake ABC transporter family permease subunit [Verrucomicrobiales bacterium]|nr:iron chelate uptake ABC transporter family permease subunit [Verrucomicrobiales bacterium]